MFKGVTDAMIDKTVHMSRVIARILLIAMVLFFVIGVIYNIASAEPFQAVSLQESFTDESGSPVSLNHFTDMQNGDRVYYTFSSVAADEDLFFRCRNMFVDVYMDGKQIYADERETLPLFGRSPGTRWHAVNLPESKGTATVMIVGTPCYGNSKGRISDLYFGNLDDIHKLICSKSMASFLLTLMWFSIGTVMIVIYVFCHKFFHLEKDFLYLSVLTFFSAEWCSAETHMWQFFFGCSEFFHFLGYISLMSLPVAGGLLAGYRETGKWKIATLIYTGIAEVNLLITTTLHLTGLVEYHYTVITVHVLLFSLIPFAIRLINDYSEKEIFRKYKIQLITTFVILVGISTAGIVTYLMGNYDVYAFFIRIALFFFLLLILGFQTLNVANVFRKGLQSELNHELALTDHLTKFYNRAGYAEHLEEYEKAVAENKPLGIIQFDVNNLKKVNDNQGHEKGDELICLASSGIYQSFGMTGHCYRMGGDEFMVVLTGEDPEEDFKKGIEALDVYCGYANSVEDRTFDVAIAYGFALAKPGDVITVVQERADVAMYNKKREMKAVRED